MGAFYKDKGCWLVKSSVLTWKWQQSISEHSAHVNLSQAVSSMWNTSSDVGHFFAGTGWLVHSLIVLYCWWHWSISTMLNNWEEKKGIKKADCDSDPCFPSEAPPDPSCGANWDSTWMLLLAFTARWVQFTCLIRFTLCTQVWSINIQVHITTRASFFCLPSLTPPQIHQIQRKWF